MLKATVHPQGQPTDYFFEYGITTAYGSQTAQASAGSWDSAKPVTAAVTGLQASTTYHFRVVATNQGGTTRGPDRSFTTLAAPPGDPGTPDPRNSIARRAPPPSSARLSSSPQPPAICSCAARELGVRPARARLRAPDGNRGRREGRHDRPHRRAPVRRHADRPVRRRALQACARTSAAMSTSTCAGATARPHRAPRSPPRPRARAPAAASGAATTADASAPTARNSHATVRGTRWLVDRQLRGHADARDERLRRRARHGARQARRPRRRRALPRPSAPLAERPMRGPSLFCALQLSATRSAARVRGADRVRRRAHRAGDGRARRARAGDARRPASTCVARERPDDVVVVAIDAKSFDVLREQWPFPRSLHGARDPPPPRRRARARSSTTSSSQSRPSRARISRSIVRSRTPAARYSPPARAMPAVAPTCSGATPTSAARTLAPRRRTSQRRRRGW